MVFCVIHNHVQRNLFPRQQSTTEELQPVFHHLDKINDCFSHLKQNISPFVNQSLD